MDVTRDNFEAASENVIELIRTSDLVAFDLEMTGITAPGVTTPESVDLAPAEAYALKRAAASHYNIIQVGLCTFHRNQKKKKGSKHSWIARPFNFYLFPPNLEDLSGLASSSRDVRLSASAVHFLRRHDMSFDRWVYSGVPYVDETQEKALLAVAKEAREARLKQRDAAVAFASQLLKNDGSEGSSNRDGIAAAFSSNDLAWLRNSLNLIKLLATAGGDSGSDGFAAARTTTVLSPVANRAARDVAWLAAEAMFDNIQLSLARSSSSGRRNDAMGLVAARVTPEEKRARESEEEQRERRVLSNIGFRRVFSALTTAGVPVVGHNAFADLLFLMHSLDRPLPENGDGAAGLAAFAARAHTLFPGGIFDTKYISGLPQHFPAGRFESTHLGGLYEAVAKNVAVDIELPLGFQNYDPRTLRGKKNGGGGGGGPAHEAGYDAMMTGTVLLSLLREANVPFGKKAADVVGNRVALFRSLYAVNLHLSQKSGRRLSSQQQQQSHLWPAQCAEFLPPPDAPLLRLEHPPSMRFADVESMLLAAPDTAGAGPFALHGLPTATPNAAATLVVPSQATLDVDAFATRAKAVGVSVSRFVPPHQRPQAAAPSLTAVAAAATATLHSAARKAIKKK